MSAAAKFTIRYGAPGYILRFVFFSGGLARLFPAAAVLRGHQRQTRLQVFPVLREELLPIMAQILTGTRRRIRNEVTHDALPENPVVGSGINLIFDAKVEALGFFLPPGSIA